MTQYFLSTKWFFRLAALLLVSGLTLASCGGSAEISVQTGTLSKAEFIKRAGTVCAGVRNTFARDFGNYSKDHFPRKFDSEADWAADAFDKTVVPNYEVQMIKQLSAIGVPKSEEDELVSFIEALQDRLGELESNPEELVKSPYPFLQVAQLAKKYGFTACAGAFS